MQYRNLQGNRDSQGSLQSTTFVDEVEKVAQNPSQLEGTEADEILQAIEEELNSLPEDSDPVIATRLIESYNKIKKSLLSSDPYMNDL